MWLPPLLTLSVVGDGVFSRESAAFTSVCDESVNKFSFYRGALMHNAQFNTAIFLSPLWGAVHGNG